MALGYLNATAPDWAQLVTRSRDAATGMFGVWPLNLHAASRAGRLGAVEAFCDFSEPCSALRAGSPVIASIRFEADALTGAPLTRTPGHLVLVHGVCRTQVRVNDPAASPCQRRRKAL